MSVVKEAVNKKIPTKTNLENTKGNFFKEDGRAIQLLSHSSSSSFQSENSFIWWNFFLIYFLEFMSWEVENMRKID